MRRALVWLSFCALVAPWFVHAQSAPPRRPRVGLVLEGGSAYGLAHIGVLQWLEDHRIPVDMVAGTSMGGLVGGFYATGMRPAEIQALIAGLDWTQLLSGKLSYSDLSFRRKEDRRNYPTFLELGLRHGVNLPTGLNSGHFVGLLLSRQTIAYSGLDSFDALPIPFACVATDLVSGQPVVLRHGSLPEAMRTTMSLPAIFSPRRNGKELLVDGGLLNNMPVDVAKQMGADIIIAVHLKPTSFPPNSRVSLTGAIARGLQVVVAANEMRSMELADILITADLAGIESLDYERWREIIPRGYQGAEKKLRMLQTVALSEADWTAHLAARQKRRLPVPPPPADVAVSGIDKDAARALEEEVRPQLPEFHSAAALERQLTLILGRGRYESLSYGLDQKGTLRLHPIEKDHGPPFLLPTLEMDASGFSDFRLSLQGRMTAFDLWGPRSELRLDFGYGTRTRVQAEMYKPLRTNARWFFAPRVFASEQQSDLYYNGDALAKLDTRQAGGGADLGMSINRFSELRMGYEIGTLRTKVQIGLPILPDASGPYRMTTLRYAMDRLDNPIIASRGTSLVSQFRWFDKATGVPGGLPQLEVQASHFRPTSAVSSVFMLASAGTSFTERDTGLHYFTLGGPFRLGSYAPNELVGNQYWNGTLGYKHLVGRLPIIFGGGIYAGVWYEVGKMWGGLSDVRLPQSGSGGLMIQSPMGPLLIGGSVGDRGRAQWYLRFGRIF